MPMMMSNYEFQDPWLLLLFLLIPFIIWWQHFRKAKHHARMPVPGLSSMSLQGTARVMLYRILPLLKYIGLAALIIALARPRSVLKEEEVKAEGIDIMMVMDLSSSMLARDFTPDRLTASKELAQDFIDKRPHDRVGLVVFAGESFTQSPLTTDHRIVKQFLAGLESGLLEDGTAIGMGLASAVNRLKESPSESKVVILLTDGVNNAGYIKPMTAAEIAQELNVKVYTIGVGSQGTAVSPISRRSDGTYIFGRSRVEIDEALLTEISTLTGGRYFRAVNKENLQMIYEEIDRLEKTEIEVTVFNRYADEFRFFLLVAFVAFIVEWILRFTLLKTMP